MFHSYQKQSTDLPISIPPENVKKPWDEIKPLMRRTASEASPIYDINS